MTDPSKPGFNPGGVQDRADTRDFQYEEIGFGTAPFNWSEGYDIETRLGEKLPVKDQGQSFSCGGQAWASYAAVLEAIHTLSLEERSAKFFYAQTYQQGGGSNGRDNADVFINQGACEESLLTSYENGHTPSEAFITRGQDILESHRIDAKKDRGFAYSQTGTNIETVAQALRDNFGVVLGVDGQNNGTWRSAFPTCQKWEWRHWVYAGKAKLINGKKHIGFLNSWGKDTGEEGWQWLSEDYFDQGHVWSGWTHTFYNLPPPPGFHHKFMVNLVYKQPSVDIKALQTALQLERVFPVNLKPTDLYGDITASAVLKFRSKYKISSASDPLGRNVGPLTRTKLNQIFN